MENISHKEQERQQAALQRIEQQLEKLEERITALLSSIDLEPMIPGQCAQQKHQQDILRRTDQGLDMLEERFTSLLSNTDPTSKASGQCVQAVSRLCTLMTRLLELRTQYAKLDESKAEVLRNLVLSGEDDGENPTA